MMDEWAVIHPITALAYEKFGTEAWVWYRGLGLWKYDTFSRKLSQATKGFLASVGVNGIASYGNAMILAGQGGITLIGAEGERWQQMTPEQRQQMRQRWQQATPEQRQQMRDRAQRLACHRPWARLALHPPSEHPSLAADEPPEVRWQPPETRARRSPSGNCDALTRRSRSLPRTRR
jgi:hypothetical protein